jgi:hypothetical protein
MHVRFIAEVCHNKHKADDSERTKFLALSKPGEGRAFLEVRAPHIEPQKEPDFDDCK